jgi:hypothetical protein|tara:strand:- start:435 stop:896 length:462 start_codon:yes stop_codon:yes gene_type:complete
MIKQKILLLVIFTFLTSCGYQPLYNNSNENIILKKIILIGDKKINRKIISLLGLKESTEKSYGHVLTINSKKQRVVIAKDTAGNAAVFKLIISSDFKIEKNKEILKEKTFEENFIFSKLKDATTFDLLQYQKILEENLIISITSQVNIYLNSQ